jgi:SLT domain-containing protein
LENVQGDERDVILFSVGYGPDENGKVSMNFGPLNNVGGERRLNVAVSRARYEMMIFSTLRPEQIDLNRSGAKGVEGLKRFLEFAQTGRVAVSSTNSKVGLEDMSSALVDAIANQIEAMGYRVDKQVGRSNFKVDIAVVNPKDEGTYLLGILCDGKTYYETKTERDREICQPNVLNMLNWNVMKVWSVDWFLNREVVVKRIKAKIEELLNPTPPAEKKTEEAKVSQSIKASSNTTEMKKSSEVSDNSQSSQPSQPASKPSETSSKPAPSAPIDHNLPYKLAKLAKVKGGIPVNEVIAKHEATVRKELAEILSVEQPVTLNWLSKRIAEHWEVSNTAALRTWISRLVTTIPNAYTDAINKNENPIYWNDFEESIGYDKYRKESERAIDEIPLVEVMNAMKESVEQQVAVPVDDLVKHATKIFGFIRTTPKILASANKAVEMMKKLSWITVDENGIAKME